MSDTLEEAVARWNTRIPAQKAPDAYTPAQSTQWQPIETAPKDGTRIFLFAPGCLKKREGRVIGHWYKHPSVQGWITEAFDCGDYEFTPTRWQPLPDSPSVSSTERARGASSSDGFSRDPAASDARKGE